MGGARAFRRRQELRDRKEIAKVIKRNGGAEAIGERLAQRQEAQRRALLTAVLGVVFAGGFAWARVLPLLMQFF